MRCRKLRRRYLLLGGILSLGCGMAVSELCGQGPLHDRAPPPCVLNAPCLPNRATWGYYEPRWRRWPAAPALGAPSPAELETGLPSIDPPFPEQEDLRVPTPVTPIVPLETAPAPELEAAPPAGLGPAVPGAGALEPTPAAPLPNGLGPDAPLRSAPLPTTPLPDTPLPEGITPQAPPTPAPTPLNPFDGAEADPSRFGDDPPPALPPSLRSSRRERDAMRAAEQGGRYPTVAAGVLRLPSPASRDHSQDRYDVKQASATVWASGTDDIRPTDPNAGRVQQAIHHEPLK